MPHPDTPRVSSLHYYPIKSCKGIELQEGTIDERGFLYDRGWLIVDKKYSFVTQRDYPKMAMLEARVMSVDDWRKAGSAPEIPKLRSSERDRKSSKELPDSVMSLLVLSAPDMVPIAVPELSDIHQDDGLEERTVQIWKDQTEAIDQGDAVAKWLSKYLGHDLRLVRRSDSSKRPVQAEDKNASPALVNFQDGYPFLVISEGSLADLNRRMESPLPMNRFRPNIVVKNVEPFAEDTWKLIKIGDVTFEVDKPCARCVITTTDQITGERGKEPLKTLATFRLVNNEALFGQNLIHTSPGVIKVNDQVEILKMKS